MMIANIYVADSKMVLIKRIYMHTVSRGHIHATTDKAILRLRLTINLLPTFSSVNGLHGAVPVSDNCHVAIFVIKKSPHTEIDILVAYGAYPHITYTPGTPVPDCKVNFPLPLSAALHPGGPMSRDFSQKNAFKILQLF